MILLLPVRVQLLSKQIKTSCSNWLVYMYIYKHVAKNVYSTLTYMWSEDDGSIAWLVLRENAAFNS